MTEDTSPENLRKFLESDDPALIRMGLSMAKGVGVPDEMLMEILWMYMLHDDKTIRAAAKSTFIKLAPKDVKQAVKENWIAWYRTPSTGITASRGHKLGILGNALGPTSLGRMTEDAPFVRRLIKALRDKDRIIRQDAANALGKIGDERAIEPLIKVLGDSNEFVRGAATGALGEIGDVRAVLPLIQALEDDGWGVAKAAAEALGNIGDTRAVEPLIKALKDDDSNVSSASAEALGKIGDPRALDPLITALEDGNSSGAKALGEITEANIKGKEKENVLRFLESDDPAMVLMGASMLKGILE